MHNVLNLFLTLFVTIGSGKKSFTIVLDTTSSMEAELDIIRSNFRNVANVLKDSNNIENYILLTFNDPVVGPPSYSSSPHGLVSSLNTLKVNGGQDCPENSIDAIENALEISEPESYIFVFTDAYAKDINKYYSVDNLCRRTRSQVIVFLSGDCHQSESSLVGNVDVYYDVARSCAGAVFRLKPTGLIQVMTLIEEIVKNEWNDVTTQVFSNCERFSISVDSFTKDVVVAVNGEHSVSLTINRDGRTVEQEIIVDTKRSMVVRIVDPEIGEYFAVARCTGSVTTTIYRKHELPFIYGFSTRCPKILKETSLRPIPGHRNYILIVIREVSNVTLDNMELVFDGNRAVNLTLEENAKKRGFFVTNYFFEPYKSFRISFSGADTSTYKNFKVSTNNMTPQLFGQTVKENQWVKPSIEVIELDSTTVEFGQNTTLACRITGYPKPKIVWEDDDGRTFQSEDVLLVTPYVYISYANIDNLGRNCTIYCKAQNLEGEGIASIDLLVIKPFTFDVLKTPHDETIEYGTEGKLFCEVNAYPEAITKWYHNDSLIVFDTNIEINSNSILIIKNMSLEDTGEYKCLVENGVEKRSFTAVVSISGFEAPMVEVPNSNIVLKPGDWTEIVCNIVNGSPTPDLTWSYKLNEYFDVIPEGVYNEGSKLKIPVVKTEHSGVYKCLATNLLGEDHKEVTIKVQYAPEIANSFQETMIVKEGDIVELKCDVDAEPKANVHWEMSQDDVIVAFDNRHTTDEQNTHRFDALWKDSGSYHCIAENEVGRSEKTVTVNVLVPPYIQTPESKTMTVKVGDNVRMSCNVLYGNPVPSTKWEFIALNSSTTVLFRGKSSSILQLPRVTTEHEGTYLCKTDNEVGSDSIKIYLKVHE